MSQTELINTNESRDSQTLPIKPILKSTQQKINQAVPRLDWAGNEIMKGGSHKIAFSSQQTTPRTFMDILSEEQYNQDNQVDEDYNEMVNCQKAKNKTKLQPELSEQSSCCFIY